MLNTILMVSACTCLVGAFVWEIAKAVTAPARERWRKRDLDRPGFPVVFPSVEDERRRQDSGGE